MLIHKTLEAFNQILGSDAPAPGGGSVAALSGALGAELISMVCRLSIGREKYHACETVLKNALSSCSTLAKSLLQRVDLDTEAFNDVMTAFKMPKETDEERAKRSKAIQSGYKTAVQSPLAIAEECLSVLESAESILGKSNTNCISDLGVAALMAHAGLEGAVMNVKINLPSIKDVVFVEETRAVLGEMLEKGSSIKDRIYKSVQAEL